MGTERTKTLLARFAYDPNTGVVSRRTCRVAAKVGAPVGTPKGNGYLMVYVDGVPYLVHRLAWLLYTGKWPKHDVDHFDGDRANNRWHNLREVSKAENHRNTHRAHRDNSSGLLGVSFDRKRNKFQSGIGVNGRRLSLGRYDDPELAHLMYLTAKAFFHPHSKLGGARG